MALPNQQIENRGSEWNLNFDAALSHPFIKDEVIENIARVTKE